MDKIDRMILRLLQHDASLSVGDIAERVSISKSACWRRIQNLEKDGIILQRVALLDHQSAQCDYEPISTMTPWWKDSEPSPKTLAECLRYIA